MGLGFSVQTWRVGHGCFFGSNNIHIGRSSYIGPQCFFDTSAHISIGDSCDIAMRVLFITSSHVISYPRRAGDPVNLPIEVGSGTWIGAGVIVLPGVKIGPRCVVASGSVVSRDCDQDTLYAGVPAKPIRTL